MKYTSLFPNRSVPKARDYFSHSHGPDTVGALPANAVLKPGDIVELVPSDAPATGYDVTEAQTATERMEFMAELGRRMRT
jgi:hypothetical protein